MDRTFLRQGLRAYLHMEKHIQTLLSAIILAAILWVGNSVLALRDSTAELRGQMSAVNQQLDEMNRRFDKYLTRAEAEARFDMAQGRLERLEHQEQRERN